MSQSIWVVIPAAGTGSRFGSETPKQHLPFFNKTVLQHTLNRFISRSDISGIVLCVSSVDHWIHRYEEIHKVSQKMKVITGGESRTASVHNALLYLKNIVNEEDLIVVHDAARPCVRQSSLELLFRQAKLVNDGVVLAYPATDTIKIVENSTIKSTLDRQKIWCAQTPQIFRYKLLLNALEFVKNNNIQTTDEASAIEFMGLNPFVVQGRKDNIKITTPEDLALAEFYLQKIMEEND